MKKLLFLLILGLFSLFSTTHAQNITVPRSTAKADILVGRLNGTYGVFGVGSDGACLIASSTTSSGLVWGSCATGGGSGITSLNGLLGATQTFATGTATGIGLNITSSGSIHTFTPTVSSGYIIPLSASTTQWSNLYNNLYTRLTVATSSIGGTFYVSTSSPGNLTINFPANLLSTTTAAATYEPILTKGNLTETVTGLEFDATRQVIGGAAALSLTSGYVIPLSASTTEWTTARNIVTASSTNWDTAYTLSHAAVTLAGQNYLSLSGQQITAAQINLTSHVTGVLPISNGGTGTSTAPSASQLLVGNGSGFDYATLPSCSNTTTEKLNYNSTTRTFTCNTDQSGGGGSLSGGTVGFVTTWASSTGVTIGTLRDNGTVSGVNATSSSYSFNVQGSGALNPLNVTSSTGTSILHVGVNSRVGINTTTPTHDLSVAGDIRLTGALQAESQILFNSPVYTQFQANVAGVHMNFKTVAGTGDIVFSPNATDTLYVNDNQTVGLNTSTPSAILAVAGTSTLPTLPVFRVASSTNAPLFTVGANGSTTISNLNTAGVVRSTDTGSLFIGKVGVGSMNSEDFGSFTCNGSSCNLDATYLTTIGSGAPGFLSRWNGTNTLAQGLIQDNGTVAGINSTSSSYTFNIQGSSNVNPLNIASSTGTSLLTVLGNGNVGIGTTSPQRLLHVWGNQSLGVMRVTRDTGTSILPGVSYVTYDVNAHTSSSTVTTFPNLTGAALTFSISSSTNVTSPNLLGSVGFVRDASDLTGQLRLHTYRNGLVVESTSLYLSGNTQTAGIGSSSPIAVWTVQGTSSAPTINPFTIASSSGAQLFTVTAAGRVGINSSVPSSLFTVDSNTTNATTTIQYDSVGTKGVCFKVKDSDGSGYTYISYNNGAQLIGTGSCE